MGGELYEYIEAAVRGLKLGDLRFDTGAPVMHAVQQFWAHTACVDGGQEGCDQAAAETSGESCRMSLTRSSVDSG